MGTQPYLGPGLIVVGRWWLVIGGQVAPGEYPPPMIKACRADKSG